jgi:hypothetical protein
MKKDTKKRLKQLEKGDRHSGDIYEPPKKKKDKKLKSKPAYELALNYTLVHLYELVLSINGIKAEEYFGPDGISIRNNIKLNKKFKKLSSLDWNKQADFNSLDFRGRFCTIFLMRMIRTCHSNIKGMYKTLYPDTKKHKMYMNLLNQMLLRIDMLVVSMLSRDVAYGEPLEAMYQILSVTGDMDSELARKVQETKEFLIENCSKRKIDDGIIINNILKLAYMLSTNSTKLKKTPEFIEGDYRDDDDLMMRQEAQLGYAILRAQNKGKESLLYDVLIEAKPSIMVRYTEEVNEYPEIVIGCQALFFTGLFVDDPYVTMYIKKMM